MKTFLLILSFFFYTFSGLIAQNSNDIKKNGIYLESYIIRHDFSNGFVSLNYERIIGKKERTNLRIGLYPDFESIIAIPVTLTRITRPQNHHHFEYGLGIIYRIEHFISDENPSKEWYYDFPGAMIPLMYRFQKQEGFYFRAGANLIISWPTLPLPSLSAGYRF